MQNQNEAIAFYDQHYEGIGSWFLTPGEKTVLKNESGSQRCRFCGEQPPQATFKLEAHALPEALGNKSLFSDYECDACNAFFGKGIENDFGNWSKPMRTFARIRGKKGIPTLKKEGTGGWRIEYDDSSGFNITRYEDTPDFLVINEETLEVTFQFRRDVHTPVAVLKAFVKMGLTLLPEAEVQNFSHAVKWIKNPDHNKGLVAVSTFPVIYSFIPGPMPFDKIALLLYRRKNGVDGVPYAFFTLAYGNEAFQVILPSPEKDASINGKTVTIMPFPTPYDVWPTGYGLPRRGLLDLTCREQVKDEVFKLTMKFESQKKSPAQQS